MLFARLYDRRLAQASYFIGCQVTGEAIVIDPNRDTAQYLATAATERMRITHVTETHIHADFASGTRELARRARAQPLLSGDGGPDWQYDFAAESGAKLLHDGDVFHVGNLRFDVLHTPGHTPEHVSFVVTDTPASPNPLMVLTGDFVFVGDVGRPDLLEKAAGIGNTMEASARDLWRSIARFRALPDYLQVWPGHGAGSACGKALGAVPSTTVGYEKMVNWGITSPDEATFVRSVLEGQPEPPAYFARMKRMNKEGPPMLGDIGAPALLSSDALARHRVSGGVVVDLRPAVAFASGHLARSISVPLNNSFTTYAGSALTAGVPIAFVATDDAGSRTRDAARELALIGFDSIAGFIAPSSLATIESLTTLERVAAVDAIARHAAGVSLIDVRNTSEWAVTHVATAVHVPFPQLAERANELPRGAPLLVHCQSGSRSGVAASLLCSLGFDARDAGGIEAWERSGGPVEMGGR